MTYYLSIDIGGTAIKYGLLTEAGTFIEKHEMATEAYKGGPAILEKVKDLIKQYQEKNPLSGVAISSAGMVDPDKGEIFYSGPQIPNYAGTSFKSEIEDCFHIPCEIENDVNCAGLAEAISGNAKDSKVALCLTIGTGIGGCLLLDNHIFSGVGNSACEVGYMHLGKGSFQDLASTTALIKDVAKRKNESEESWNGRRIFEEAKKGDQHCIAAIQQTVDFLGQGLANMAYVTNPDLIVLGGGIMAQEDYLAPLIKKALKKYLVSSLFEVLDVRFAQHKNDAGMLGAYYHFCQKQKERPVA